MIWTFTYVCLMFLSYGGKGNVYNGFPFPGKKFETFQVNWLNEVHHHNQPQAKPWRNSVRKSAGASACVKGMEKLGNGIHTPYHMREWNSLKRSPEFRQVARKRRCRQLHHSWLWLVKGFSFGRPLKINLSHWWLTLHTQHCRVLPCCNMIKGIY